MFEIGAFMSEEKDKKEKDDKWEFEDYAFLITGIIVFFLLVVPDILLSQFGISILGGSLGDIAPTIVDDLEYGHGYKAWTLTELRALSPLLFLLTTTIVYTKEAIDARKSGGYKGSMFTHTFESLLEDAIYFATTTIILYSAVLTRSMYTSWLAAPVTWVLFVFILPLVRKKDSSTAEGSGIPWFLLLILAAGVIVEAITGAWIAFPLSWLIICVFKFVNAVRAKPLTIDIVFDILYYAFSIILMGLGIALSFWITSWTAFPIAFLICWIASKTKRFKREPEEDEG